ncbi:MAG TPA: M13 family metallopeptidase [Pyrinomonadaceae bacterium]
MTPLRSAILLLVVSAVVFMQGSPQQHGIQVADLNKDVSACDDFYEFANGGWRAKNPIPASMSRWSRRWEAGETTKDKLKEILDEVSAKQHPKGSVEQLIGDFYSSCNDEAQANKLNIKPIQPLLIDIDRIKTQEQLQAMFARFRLYGLPSGFGFGGGSDTRDPNNVIAQVGAGGLGLPDRDYYLKPDDRFKQAREKYTAHMARMFQLAGYSEAEAKGFSDTVFKLETKFAENWLDRVALRTPKNTDHKMELADLQKLMPDFNWTVYYKTLGVTPGTLNVSQPKFMEAFNHELTATPLDDWKLFLKWKLINSSADWLSSDFVDEDFAFSSFLTGAKEMKPRWKRCVEATDGLLGEALGKKYVEKYFPPEAKARMQDMVKNLRKAMQETIEGLDWMSPETKKKALEKLATFNPKIGYPDKWTDYSKLTITRDSFWKDVTTASEFAVRDNLTRIGRPVDRGLWGMTPPTSDAYYSPLLNEIVFPAGILQPPAFDVTANDAVNYGAIGVVIGHEISHGFDDQGAQFDAQGRLNNWWTDEDLKKFQAKTSCVANQFDNYFIEPGIHHNGRLVLGESIGDLAGARIAYRAFQISQQGKPQLPTIDGFTPNQQFFIAWGQFRGDATRPETARLMIQNDPHPVAKYRVIGPVSNLTEFAEAFQCKVGQAMVRPPEQRCEVW